MYWPLVMVIGFLCEEGLGMHDFVLEGLAMAGAGLAGCVGTVDGALECVISSEEALCLSVVVAVIGLFWGEVSGIYVMYGTVVLVALVFDFIAVGLGLWM